MHVITGRNVNSIYRQAVELVRTKGVLQPSRAGDVLTVLEPVVLETMVPTERVLFDIHRDANPFFHFFEALWMLAGRNDSVFLNRFVRNFGERFAEYDESIHGAYGYRWRKHFGFDQLNTVIAKLKANQYDRQVVITMWDPELKWGHRDENGATDLLGDWKDRPCNTHIYPRIVDGKLDIMVCCRSNDVVWGATGANAVHFSFLLEYLAGRIGVGVGVMRQMTTNLHGYTDVLAKIGEPSAEVTYVANAPIPIGTDWECWDSDLMSFLRMAENGNWDDEVDNVWFNEVARPMWMAHAHWRLGHSRDTYMNLAAQIAAPDWRLAATQWLGRRKK
jgi:hypothetical protein